MEYTKGEWALIEDEDAFQIYVPTKFTVAKIHKRWGNDAKANAHLIVTAVNACIKLNPDNPMAVAKSISDLYEALQELLKSYEQLSSAKPLLFNMLEGEDRNLYKVCESSCIRVEQALAKAEGE